MKSTMHSKPFKSFFFLVLTISTCLLYSPRLFAQAYIEHSRLISGVSVETVSGLAVDAGYSYILGTTSDINYPVTVGSIPGPGIIVRPVLTKLDPSGNLVWSRYLPFSNTGGLFNTAAAKMSFENGVLYIVSIQTATDIPVTDGSVAGGGGTDIMFTKIEANSGAVIHNGYLGGNNSDNGILEMVVVNGEAYIAYGTNSSNIPTTTGPAYTSGYDIMVQKLNASGNIVYGTYFGSISAGLPNLNTAFLTVDNGTAYLAAGVAATTSFTTTDGSVFHGGADFAVLRLDATGNRSFATFIGGSGSESAPSLLIDNGDIYLSGFSTSTNYPVTDATTNMPIPPWY